MLFDPYDNPFPSKRSVVYGLRGMAASGQALASQAGLEMLQAGGNAVDAAVAMAIALTIVEPCSNGLGSDAFAIVWSKEGLTGLNASGYAGSKADAGKLREKGFDRMPAFGFAPVTVSGAPSAWKALSGRFGRLPFQKLFEPGIRYAREGYAVSPMVASGFRGGLTAEKKAMEDGRYGEKDLFMPWLDTFASGGRAPLPGEKVVLKDHAATLEELAQTGCESFYRGRLAGIMADWHEKNGGFITGEDLAEYYPEWTDPIHVNYRGYDVWEIPPNGHGIIALMALNILNGFQPEKAEKIHDPEYVHRSIEALKLAFADGKRYVTDPRYMSVTAGQLLSPDYAGQRRNLITGEALEPFPGKPESSGTVYLCAADGDGNMISYIQSNYGGFGSGLVVPGTGIALQNRGKEFSLDPEHDNYLLPRKKPYHTIIPGFLTKDGAPVGPFGVMGGYMQPQGHLQVVENLIDFHMNPQQALDAPRWQWTGSKDILAEYDYPTELIRDLQRRGHRIRMAESVNFGRGQVILRQENGTLAGGTEPRTDGAVLGW